MNELQTTNRLAQIEAPPEPAAPRHKSHASHALPFQVRLVEPPAGPVAEQLALVERKLPVFSPLGGGMYRHNKTGTLYERPTISGKRTWRKLASQKEKAARDEMARRRTIDLASQSGAVQSPYGRPVYIFTRQVIEEYLRAGTPDHQRRKRPASTECDEIRHCQTLIRRLGKINIDDMTMAALDNYTDERQKEVAAQSQKRYTGRRTIDREINTLNNAFVWAVRSQLVKHNPISDIRIRCCTENDVTHCREFMPRDIDDLHAVAAWLFKKHACRSEAAGWQYLIQAMTGIRPHEALGLRTDAAPGQSGYIEADRTTGAWKSMHVRRAKDGINPFVIITPELQAALQALFDWKAPRYPESPWYFPSIVTDGKTAIYEKSLSHVMDGSKKHFGRKLTAYGTRAYYVTVRRSWGISDAQIAIELGQSSGGALIAKVYGGVPLNWQTGDGPKMSWTPAGPPAWSVLKTAAAKNVLQLPNTKAA